VQRTFGIETMNQNIECACPIARVKRAASL